MKDENIFNQFRFWRTGTIELIKGLDLSVMNKIPEGFNNNIRWHAGHVLVSWDQGIYSSINEDRKLPKMYHSYFPRGSKPANWTEEPPAVSEVLGHLENQTNEIIKACRGRMDDKMTEPFLDMTTVGEMFLFLLNHELLHQGNTRSMLKALGK